MSTRKPKSKQKAKVIVDKEEQTEEAADISYTSPMGKLLLQVNQLMKKPVLDVQLSETLDEALVVLGKVDERVHFCHFPEAALFVQSAANLYGKKIDIFWDDVMEFQRRNLQYMNEKAPDEIKSLEERINRYKRRKKPIEMLFPQETTMIIKSTPEVKQSTLPRDLPITPDGKLYHTWRHLKKIPQLHRATKENPFPPVFRTEQISYDYRRPMIDDHTLTYLDSLDADFNEEEMEVTTVNYRQCLTHNLYKQMFDLKVREVLKDPDGLIDFYHNELFVIFKFKLEFCVPLGAKRRDFDADFQAYLERVVIGGVRRSVDKVTTKEMVVEPISDEISEENEAIVEKKVEKAVADDEYSDFGDEITRECHQIFPPEMYASKKRKIEVKKAPISVKKSKKMLLKRLRKLAESGRSVPNATKFESFYSFNYRPGLDEGEPDKVLFDDSGFDEDFTESPEVELPPEPTRVGPTFNERLELEQIDRNVAEWKARIRPVLHSLHNVQFDIHEYGTRLIDGLEMQETKPFGSFVDGKEPDEVMRYFVSSLHLANMGNVAIGGAQAGGFSNETMQLTLLSEERHHEHLNDFAEEGFLENFESNKDVKVYTSTPCKKKRRV